MTAACLALSLATSLAPAQADPSTPAEPRALTVLRQFDQLGKQALWPGFEPRTSAVEV